MFLGANKLTSTYLQPLSRRKYNFGTLYAGIYVSLTSSVVNNKRVYRYFDSSPKWYASLSADKQAKSIDDTSSTDTTKRNYGVYVFDIFGANQNKTPTEVDNAISNQYKDVVDIPNTHTDTLNLAANPTLPQGSWTYGNTLRDVLNKIDFANKAADIRLYGYMRGTPSPAITETNFATQPMQWAIMMDGSDSRASLNPTLVTPPTITPPGQTNTPPVVPPVIDPPQQTSSGISSRYRRLRISHI